MNTEALHIALQQSFSPDASLRLPAEQHIKNLKLIPGATQMLLEIAAEKQVRILRSLRDFILILMIVKLSYVFFIIGTI